ncbi:hypothetical protein TL16_g07431 [Triparma laevis f. inornata]|uniref:Methyltransferase type 11 domain-containing protein n=1 Tax=Triparma laevis f. inornata TaxID=1714386 RepID=A0A9W7ATG8_9STRA|nr:hypothetical protein TL16_g07431 [Triparma laevis f. inornata]
MSKSRASESIEHNESHKISGKRAAGDEEDEYSDEKIESLTAQNLTTSTAVSTVPATTDQFAHTPEFRRHFVEFVHVHTLMALRVVTKGWNAAAGSLIDEGVESGELLVHDGKDITMNYGDPREERLKLITQVIFLLNITKIGTYACCDAINLIVVDIPEGMRSIGEYAFGSCTSLTTLSFPTTLTPIGDYASRWCCSLDNVDLLHTNLQELGQWAFAECSELKPMTILDSFQKLGKNIFYSCSKLVLSSIDIDDEINEDVVTSKVISYLRSQQLLSATPPAPPTDEFMHTPEFKRYFVEFIHVETLMALRLATKVWTAAADALIDEGVRSGELMVHGGNDLSSVSDARIERRKRVTRVVFLLNILKIGSDACYAAINLVVVDIPEGIESIGSYAFHNCTSLTTVSISTTLRSIGHEAFWNCSSLESVDLLHTNLQVLGDLAFANCSDLTSMTIPDSLQTLGDDVFHKCSKLLLSNIGVNSTMNDPISEVIAHLRSKQTTRVNIPTSTKSKLLKTKLKILWLKKYWDERYDAGGLSDEPFDWMCGWKQLQETVPSLIDGKNARILMIGCGNAPLSSDFWDAGYKKQINIDYSEVVIEQQQDRFPHMEWVVMDALNMAFEHGEFDYVFDKSLIDTMMCYEDGVGMTEKLFLEMHRVLKPGGRLIQVSLHKEDEVDPFAASPGCSFVVTTCKLKNMKVNEDEIKDTSKEDLHQMALFHTFAVFDKLDGLNEEDSQHPLKLRNALSNSELAALKVLIAEERSKSPRTRMWRDCTASNLVDCFDAVLEDWAKQYIEEAEKIDKEIMEWKNGLEGFGEEEEGEGGEEGGEGEENLFRSIRV